MTVGDYKYFKDYLTNLNIFYKENLSLFTITEKCKLCDEIKRIKQLLKIK